MTTENKVGGRPRIELSEEDIAKITGMVQIMCTQDEICAIFEISEDTLDRRLKELGYRGFADFYKKHAGKGKQSLRRLQWKSAEEGSVPMQIWLGKNWLGQTDKVETEVVEIPPLQIIAITNEADSGSK